MLRQSVMCLAALIALAGPARAEDEGRLNSTGGLVGIEGAAGGGLVPWAI